jgi:hypothetical protein
MRDQDLETVLTDKCKALNVKQRAFDNLQKIFLENHVDKDFLCGFDQNQIRTIFDRFEFHFDRRHGQAFLKTRIGLYIESNTTWLDNIKPIGYYELDTDLNGQPVDDWFVIDKQKYPEL